MVHLRQCTNCTSLREKKNFIFRQQIRKGKDKKNEDGKKSGEQKDSTKKEVGKKRKVSFKRGTPRILVKSGGDQNKAHEANKTSSCIV